jgi:LPXTG-motif cell wall-anchored protein
LTGGSILVTQVKADTNLPANSTTVVTDNTATHGLGSNTVAGSDNAAAANLAESSGVIATSTVSANFGSVTTDSGLTSTADTNGSYAVNGSGIASLNSVYNSTAAVANTENGAVPAGSSAPSSVSFDIGQSVTIPASAALFQSAGSYSWTITAPQDLTTAGLSVAPVNLAVPGTRAVGTTNPAIQSNTNIVYVQTAGGTYEPVTYNQASLAQYLTDSSQFTGTTSSAYITGSAPSYALVTVDYTADPGVIGSLQSMLSTVLAVAGGPLSVANGAADLASNVVGILANLTTGLTGSDSSVVQTYANLIAADAAALKTAANNIYSAIGNNGMYTMNVLVPVTDNGNGTYTVSASDLNFLNALMNSLNQAIMNYSTALTTFVSDLGKVPKVSTGISLLDTLANGSTSTISSLITGFTNDLNSSVAGISTFIFDGLNSAISLAGNINVAGTATVTVGFTAQNPGTVLMTNAKANKTINLFYPETFTVSNTMLNSKTVSTAQYTSVVYEDKDILTADFDGDGWNNGQEIVNGTDPFDPNSHPNSGNNGKGGGTVTPVQLTPNSGNTKGYGDGNSQTLPDTGETDVLVAELIGASLLAVSAGFATKKRRKRRI